MARTTATLACSSLERDGFSIWIPPRLQSAAIGLAGKCNAALARAWERRLPTCGAMDDRSPIDALRRDARPLLGHARDHDALLTLIGGARYVLLGEASHGTHEFYAERAAITRRLIEEHDFDAV